MADRLTDKQKKKIIADYIDTQNFRETSRINNVSDYTVRSLVKGNKDIAQKLAQKKEENTLTTLEYMNKQHQTKKRIMDKLLKAIEEKSDKIDMFTNIKDLATAYGIILDKELKVLELKYKKVEDTQLVKVQELLNKIEEEANK